jgi:hypothetical protein
VIFVVLIPYSDPYSQSFRVSSINGSKKISMSMSAYLG